MSSNFEIRKVTVFELINVYKMQIPDFQRKFVWKDSKKKELIDSLIRNYPIGALTLYSDKSSQSYLLVDGLQRYNTMCSYLQNPADILKFSDYYLAINSDKEISRFCSENDFDEKKVKQCIKKWYESLNANNENGQYSFENMKNLMSHLKECSDSFADIDIFQRIRDLLISALDIRQKSIALIIYDGEKDDLPDLFTKINKKNVSLTPYEILHSMWYEYTMPTTYKGRDYKNEFMEYVKRDQDFKNTARTIEKFNVYMYLVALGFICVPNVSSEKKEISKSKNMLYRIDNEFVFDAFSTVCCGLSNRISSVIDGFCYEKHENDYAEEIFEIGENLSKCIILLNEFISINNIDYIKSKYFYLYLIYIIYKNDCKLSFTKSFLDCINNANWFKDKFRQVSFFNSRINDFNNYKSSTDKFMYNDENSVIFYSFKKDTDNRITDIETVESQI